MANIKIAIADDYKVYREGLKVGLSTDEDFQIILEAENGRDLLNALKAVTPDVILMDLKMPVMDGMEATQLVRKNHPEIKILVVTMYDDEKFITHMMEMGASGYLLKNSEPDEIKKAIHAVVNNGYYFSDTITKDLLKSLLLNKLINPSFPETIELSEIERDVLKMICEEKTADDISSKISLSPDSVKSIRQHLIDKIGVQNIAGLKMFALKRGIEL